MLSYYDLLSQDSFQLDFVFLMSATAYFEWKGDNIFIMLYILAHTSFALLLVQEIIICTWGTICKELIFTWHITHDFTGNLKICLFEGYGSMYIVVIVD